MNQVENLWILIFINYVTVIVLLINYIPWLTHDIDKLDLCFAVLFDTISSNIEMLCLCGGIIINNDNDIIYNRKSHEFPNAILDVS